MSGVNRDSIEQGLVLGNKSLVAEVFARNGFSVLLSVTGEEKTIKAGADQTCQGKGAEESPFISGSLR